MKQNSHLVSEWSQEVLSPPGVASTMFGVAPAVLLLDSSRQILLPEGGEIDMKKPVKIGIVSVQDLGGSAWILRYRDPSSKRDIRRRLSGLKAAEVQRIASHISQEVLAGQGYLPGKPAKIVSVREALKESIRLSNQRDYVKRNSGRRGKLFLDWLAENHSQIETFGELAPCMVQEYVRHLEEKGLAFDTIRNHLRPVKMAWRYVSENFPDAIRPLPRIRLPEQAPKELVCLNASEVDILLSWLRDHRPDLYGMGVLASLCGFRLSEAVSLRRQDVDREAGTARVADTGTHKPKNRFSYRTVPVCSEALGVLRQVIENQKVVPVTGELFGKPTRHTWDPDALSAKWRRALKTAAKATGCGRLAEVQAHRLRSSFATMAGKLGVPDRLLKAYLGHSRQDILGDHYEVLRLDDLRQVSIRMEGWRDLISEKEVGTFLATSEKASV